MKQLEIQVTSVGCELHGTLKAITRLLEKTHTITKCQSGGTAHRNWGTIIATPNETR